jgi:ribosome-associated protein
MDQNEEIRVDLSTAEPLAIAEYVVSILDAKKAGDIKLLHVADKTIITDYMVLCSGNSGTQIRSLGDEIEFKLENSGVKLAHSEGVPAGGWVLLDYGCVLVHIFSKEARKNYNLEKLYQDGDEIDISHITTEN